MNAQDEKVVGRQDPSPSVDYVESSAPQLAEGTRRDIDLQPRKGICVATRCETVEQFVSTFHRWCEDSTIFICNARWPVGTVLPFAFELANEESVLVGIGKVTEEFTTVENRFGRAGIVVAVQKLKRESVVLFRRLLAARNTGEVDRPPPVVARATPAPRALDEVRRQLRPTKLPEVRIPSPRERPITKPRAKTVLGIPTIANLSPKPAVMQIPTILPRGDAKGSRAVRVPEATPVPVIQTRATSGDAVPHAIEDASHDTVRDEIPFALRNELRLLESAAVARRVQLDVDVDVGWDVEQPLSTAELVALPTPAAVPAPTPEAILEPAAEAVPEPVAADDAVQAIVAQEAVREPVTADESVERTPTASDETPVASCDEDPAPLAISAVARNAVTGPEDTTTRHNADELPIAWWRRSLRWATRVAIASTLFVVSAAITASVDGPSLPVATESEAPAVFSTIPSAPNQTPTPAPYAAQDDQVTVSEPQEQPTADVQQRAPAPEKKPAASAKKPSRPLAATRVGRPRASKERCASLDCL